MAYKPKILIVEGDGTTRRQLESTLRVMGADPRTLTDPRQAILVVDRAKSIAAGFKAGATFSLSKPVGARELTRLLNASRGAMLAERRRYVRVPLAAAVACKWGGKQVTGQAVNLSISGILLTLAPAPEMKARVDLEFTLPHATTKVKLAGNVVRLKGNQVGLHFHEPSEEQQQVLKRFIDKTAGTATSLD
jgi:DNA-binding response OmpR family regulator